MQKNRRAILLVAGLLVGARTAQSASLVFSPRELFRVPFGKAKPTLGARVDGGNFLFPRDFTMDGQGHFFIYDTNNHRIARFSSEGTFEMEFRYLPTAQQMFAHTDSRQNLWLLLSDPGRGMYYGVYDSQGKPLRQGLFSRYNHFRLHLDDSYTLHVILSSAKEPAAAQSFIFDEDSFLMKKENVARPPENHHQVRKSDHVYFIDQMPDGSKEDAHHMNRITDEFHRPVAAIKGTVIYVTEQGEVYTRVGTREIDVYDVKGSLKGKVVLKGLRSACASIRFDSTGNIYELDGIPEPSNATSRESDPETNEDAEDLHYTLHMVGMRLIKWERQ